MNAVVGLVFSEDDASHAPPLNGLGNPTDHIERPERTAAVMQRLHGTGLASKCARVAPRECTRDEARMCHSEAHCDALEALERADPARSAGWYEKHGWSRLGTDMYYSQATPRAARLAAGGVLNLCEEVCAGRLRSGFAVVRPPGHHACSGRMCGFCFLNSAAMAARAATRTHGLSRVLLLDWDVHHGNGSQVCTYTTYAAVPHM